MLLPRRIRTDQEIEAEIRAIAQGLGHFPSSSELRSLGRHDLSCQIARRGGHTHWVRRIGVPRMHSDSDTGWEGEQQAMACLVDLGFEVARPTGVKCPFDLLINDILRVDVKSARHVDYGACAGWFYRLGKVPQADLILLWQLDTHGFYALPWFVCPRTNITISTGGGKYAAYYNHVQVIRDMLAARAAEREHLRQIARMN